MHIFRRLLEFIVPEISGVIERRRATRLASLCVIVLAGAPLFLVGDLVLWNPPGLLANTAISTLTILCVFLIRQGRRGIADWVMVVSLSFVSNFATWFAGGVLVGGFPLNAIAVLIGAVVLRGPGLVITVVIATGFAAATPYSPHLYELPLSFHVFFWALTLSVLGLAVLMLINSTEGALRGYHGKNEELQQAVVELQATSLSKEYLSSLLSAMREVIVVTDTHHTIVSVNGGGADWSGWAPEDLVGKPLVTLFHGLDLAQPRLSRDVTLKRADGTVVAVVVSQGTMPEGFVWAASDAAALTATTVALRQAHQSARAANAAKTSFLANMSHELRTPLNAIIGYGELLGDEITDEAQLRDLSRIGSAAHSLLDLINGVLDLSKVEAGKVSLSQTNVPVVGVLGPVVAMIEPVVKARGLTLEVVGDIHEGGPIFTDETKLRAVLQNLLSNAVKFTDEGQIVLRVERWSRSRLPWIRFVVEDTGIGMSPGDLEQVFEPFTQGRREQEQQRQGTGLGLSICKAYIDMMGGQIYVDSALGKGSTFVVELPAARFAAQTPRTPSAPMPDGVERLDRILVIDDDPDFLEYAGRVLARDDRQVVCTPDPVQGLAWANRFVAHTILLDIDMPTLSGWAFLVRLRATRSAKSPVLVISGQAEQEVAEALGCSEFLQKPVGQRELSEAVARVSASAEAG